MTTIEKTKKFKLSILKINVNLHLKDNYDWKVSRAASLGVEISDKDKAYRASVVAEYNTRVEAVNSATTLDAINAIPFGF